MNFGDYAVVIPAYRAAGTLAHALDSVMAQTLPPRQVVVVDDGSPDGEDLARIVAAAQETVAQAGVSPASVDALYFTGGSTGLRLLVDGMAAGFPGAARVTGDRFSSVATGLGLHAQRLFGRA